MTFITTSYKTYQNISLAFVGALLVVGVFSFNALSAKAQEAPVCVPNNPDIIYSDSDSQVEGGGSAVAVTPHSAWAAASIPGATWIWDAEKIPADDTGSNPAGTVTFTRDFTIVGTPTGASLEITTDNSYVVTVNGNAIGSDSTWQSVESYSIPAGDLSSGVNTLTIVATNDGPDGPGNPAGVLYKLTVDSEVCAPEFAKVHIYKYLDDGETETQVPDDSTFPSFPMHASWVTTNFPSGEGDYVLGNSHGGAAFRYAADTSDMATPVASYNTYEITDGSVVLPIGATCAPDKFRLVGYKSGDSLEAAQGATLSDTAPTYTDFSEDKYLIVVNEKCADAGDNFCSLEVVSDTTNTVNENGDANAVATFTGHPSWTALIPGATWIWETLQVVDPLSDTTKTFKKTFTIDDVNTAVLSIAADNSYEVFINSVNVPIPTQTDEDNYRLENQDNNIDVVSYLTENAQNIIEVRVKNWALADSTWETNPAGALYKLTVNGETVGNVCEQPPTDTSSISGMKWNDVDGDGTRDEGDTGLSGWLISVFGNESLIATTTTDGSGNYSFTNLDPEISYWVCEEVQGGWSQTSPTLLSDGTVTCPNGTVGYSAQGGEGADDFTNKNFGNHRNTTSACEIGENLLLNGSFEDPTVTGDWGIFATVANWVISSDGLELWRNFMGGASDGEQNAELDGNVPTTVTQTVTTVPGATYELSFDFSPRPQTTLANNNVDALVDGSVLMSASGDGSALATTTWTGYSQTFVAGDASTDVAFTDNGTADSYGSLIDNAVLCLVSDPTPNGDTSEMVLVTPSDLNITATPTTTDWYFYDDNTDTPSTLELATEYEFITGPGNPTLGDGSVQMIVDVDDGSNDGNEERWNIATNQFAGIDLDMVSVFTFETYQPSTNPGSDQRAIYLNFDVDFDNTVVAPYAGRLVFVPTDNTVVVEDAWQSHDADSGMWRWSRYESNGNMWPDNDTDALRSWSEIVTAFPNAEMLVGGQLLFRAGEPYADGFTGAVDNVVIKVGTHTTTYNFEPVAPQPTITTNGGENNSNDDGGSSGGSSSRRQRGSSSSNDGEVLGATTGGQVLAQTSILPLGAPNTGFGGLKMCLY